MSETKEEIQSIGPEMTFIKASCSHTQQTMPQMTQSKLTKRSFDSFAIFKDPDYITGIQVLEPYNLS